MSKPEIEEILALLKGLKAEVANIRKDSKVSGEKLAMMNETIANIHQVSSDLARKFDDVVNVVGVKEPVAAKKAPVARVKKAKEETPEDEAEAEPKPAKSKAAKPKTSEKAKKKYANIMTYFRSKYLEDQSYFNGIVSAEECAELFSEHSDDLKALAGEKKLRAQIGYLYKSLSKNKKKLAELRAMMDKENDEHGKGADSIADLDHSEDEDAGEAE